MDSTIRRALPPVPQNPRPAIRKSQIGSPLPHTFQHLGDSASPRGARPIVPPRTTSTATNASSAAATSAASRPSRAPASPPAFFFPPGSSSAVTSPTNGATTGLSGLLPQMLSPLSPEVRDRLATKRQELEDALLSAAEAKTVEEKLQRAAADVEQTKRRLREQKKQIKEDKKRLRLIKGRMRDQTYLSNLMDEIVTLEELQKMEQEEPEENSITATDDDAQASVSCPVCFERPESIFCCQQCQNMVCGGCVGRLAHCPMCRQAFADKPPFRNKYAERIINRATE